MDVFPKLKNEPIIKFLIKKKTKTRIKKNNVNKPIEVLLRIWYEMTLTDQKSTKMNFL
jgi:hypothetical protein